MNLLAAIRSEPYTTAELWHECEVLRRCGIEDVSLADLESQLAELERAGDIKRDGEKWRPVYRVAKVLQGSLFS
jgi:hypothetical protein